MGTAACAPSMFSSVLTMPHLSVWRCRPGCGKIILELEYDGHSIMRHRCACNRWHLLPRDRDNLRREERR